MFKERQVVCIDQELAEVRNAVSAAALMVEMMTMLQYPDELSERQAPHFAAAVLHLVEARLVQVDRCLRGDVDPRQILGSWNSMPDSRLVTKDRIVVLRPWEKSALPKVKKTKPATRRAK